jgi:hypothetical protein
MSFWTEIKRRKVFQVATAYAIVGWLLIRVASVVFPGLQLPEWTVTFVTRVVIFCFPIALFLALAYELTPGGIQRTAPIDDAPSGRRPAPLLGYGVTAVLAAAAGVGGYWLLGSDSDARWLNYEALPRIEAYLDVADWESAFPLIRQIEQRFPDSPELEDLWTRVSWTVTGKRCLPAWMEPTAFW